MTTHPPLEINTHTEPDSAVIWLHGLGADGRDFEPIVPALQLPTDQAIRFIFPNAPVRPVTINNGMAMPAWYDIFAMGGGAEDEAGIRASQSGLEELIQAQNARGIASERIVVAGFSQGGAIALQTGLRYRERLAGIMALSTYLPLAASLIAQKSAPAEQVPILMVHGEYDEMISTSRAQSSRQIMEAAGFTVQWQTFPMGHEVCLPEISLISQWLQQVL